MTRAIWLPAKSWARKPKARHFAIRDKSKAETAERAWLKKSKPKVKSDAR